MYSLAKEVTEIQKQQINIKTAQIYPNIQINAIKIKGIS